MTKIIFLKNKDGEQYYAKTHKQAMDGLNEATSSANGLMSADDKKKLDQVPNRTNEEWEEVLIKSSSGQVFKLVVDDNGILSTEEV
ncbi:hypothetical protein [Listeria fleischmannii]|uniref:hypothetical protein n=1 Tax=Listeria fleischmannii TaxID=1069827 RepID=UPI000254F5C3|nr:hypothetical protein [Listeria fleischmannii]EIA19501.1 hypothetical protein KKC_12048 [Listeria fleischmannii subsp. coloradonensis]STY36047.1 Uncharacterised protein [Listeria fleischmannii subsp. coloradonensis]